MSKGKVESLTDEEQTKLVSFFNHKASLTYNRESHFRDQCMFLLMLDAGLRVGEVVKLVIRDLHFAGSPVGVLSVRPEIAKTKTERSIPVSIRLRDSIQDMWLQVWQHWNIMPVTFAFVGSKAGESLSIRQVRYVIQNAGIVSIGRPVHPHALRHTFATRLMRKCNIRVVQQLLGHKSLLSTQIYTHPNNQDLQTAIDSLNA